MDSKDDCAKVNVVCETPDYTFIPLERTSLVLVVCFLLFRGMRPNRDSELSTRKLYRMFKFRDSRDQWKTLQHEICGIIVRVFCQRKSNGFGKINIVLIKRTCARTTIINSIVSIMHWKKL